MYFNKYHYHDQGYTNPGRQVARATKFCAVVPYVCGSPGWILLHVALLVPKILSLLVDFRKICATLPMGDYNCGGGGGGNVKIIKLSC